MTGINRWFPAGPPIAEEQQVRRRPFIDSLESRLIEAQKVKLFEQRRSGKSSAARAVVDRFAARDRPAAAVDLARIEAPEHVAVELAGQLAAGLARLAADRRATGWLADAEVGDVTERLLDGHASPGRVLEMCAAALDDQPGAVLLDEAHHLAGWPETEQRAVREFMRDDTAVGVIVASSERHALDELTQVDGVLEYVGQRVSLPPVAREDWEVELPRRFEAVGTPIESGALALLLDESRGHPYCTMLLARESAHLGLPISEVTGVVIEAALLSVTRDEAWDLRDGDGD
jgi:hypothetical protein